MLSGPKEGPAPVPRMTEDGTKLTKESLQMIRITAFITNSQLTSYGLKRTGISKMNESLGKKT